MHRNILVALLIASVAFVATEAAFADEDEHEREHEHERVHKYAGHKKCKSCHKKTEIGNQYGAWLDSKHAKAFETLASDQAKEWGSEAGVSDPQTDEKCVKCHVTAYGVPAERLAKTFATVTNDGVQCESCHGAGYDYKKKKIMADPEEAREKGLIDPTEEVCVACHNDESPAWDPTRYTTADGKKVGFAYEQAVETIAHPVPEGYDPFANDDE